MRDLNYLVLEDVDPHLLLGFLKRSAAAVAVVAAAAAAAVVGWWG